jgi:hypothetical protein
MKPMTSMIVFAALLLGVAANAQDGPYRFVKEIPIGGEGGRGSL